MVVLRKNWFLFSGRLLIQASPSSHQARDRNTSWTGHKSTTDTWRCFSLYCKIIPQGEEVTSMQLTVEIKESRGTKVFFLTRKRVVLCLKFFYEFQQIQLCLLQTDKIMSLNRSVLCLTSPAKQIVFAFTAPDRDHYNIPGKYHRLYPVTPVLLFSGRLWQSQGSICTRGVPTWIWLTN